MRAIASKFQVDLFYPTNEIEDLFTVDRAARGLAEVGPAPQGAGFVDEALLGLGMEKGAGAVGRLG